MSEKIAISVTEASELLGISRSKMYEIMKSSGCDFALHLGKRRLISRARLEAWIDRQAEEAIKK